MATKKRKHKKHSKARKHAPKKHKAKRAHKSKKRHTPKLSAAALRSYKAAKRALLKSYYRAA